MEETQEEEQFYRGSIMTQFALYLLCIIAGIALFPLTITYTVSLFGLTVPYANAVVPTIGLIALYSALRAVRGVLD